MSNETPAMTPDNVDPEERNGFYASALRLLGASELPFMVGGAYALERYTGIARKTKDIDVFVKARDCRTVLRVLGDAGYGIELRDPAWLAKAFHHGHLLDIVFNSGNGACPVDEGWFEHAVDAEVLGVPVRLAPVEESIWQKAFIMERERFDGADIAHLILACGRELDWERIVWRFAANWEVLLAHLILYQYSFPGDADAVPAWVMRTLLARLDSADLRRTNVDRLCRGTLISRYQYLTDVEEGDYRDARLFVPRIQAA